MIRDRHNMRLVLSVPLMTAEQMFSIYKGIVWPTRILKDKFIEYKLDFDYFGLSFGQRDYLLLKQKTWKSAILAAYKSVQLRWLFSTLKYSRVCQVCISRCQDTVICAGEMFLFTIIRPHYKGTVRHSSFIFQMNNKSSYVVQTARLYNPPRDPS